MTHQSPKPLKKIRPIQVSDYDELENIVYQWTLQNQNVSDMVKKKFILNGKNIGLNPAKIKEIKNKFENINDIKKEPTHVTLTKLFVDGVSPIDALIETGCTYEEVTKVHQEFLELESKTVVSENFLFSLYELAYTLTNKEVNDEDDVLRQLDKAAMDALTYRNFVYPCNICERPIRLSNIEWPSVKKQIIEEEWRHGKCS